MVSGYCEEGDKVQGGGLCGGGLLISVRDDDVGALRQTEVATIEVDATHSTFTGIWQRLTLVDIWEM